MEAHPSFIYYGADKNKCSDLISGKVAEKPYEEPKQESQKKSYKKSGNKYKTHTPEKKTYESSAPILIATPSEAYSSPSPITEVYSTPAVSSNYNKPAKEYKTKTDKSHKPKTRKSKKKTYKTKSKESYSEPTEKYEPKIVHCKKEDYDCVEPVATPSVYDKKPVATPSVYDEEPVASPLATPSLYNEEPVASPSVYDEEPVSSPLATPSLYTEEPAETPTLDNEEEVVDGGIAPIGGVLQEPIAQQAAGTKTASLSIWLVVCVFFIPW
jgi:hypothetical protein